MKVKEVLFENKKEYIPEILEKIKDFPEIQKANERSKKQYNKVYRGIPADDETEKDVIKYDKKQDYVSTSMDKNAAIKFAYKIGHLESEENRRSENGYIITYNVDEDSIVLDTTIFGGVFMENEIIIDPKKAKVDNIESV